MGTMTASHSTDLIALIPTHKPSNLKATLESLLECDRPENFKKIVVIENGDRNGSDVEATVRAVSGKHPVEYFYVKQPNKSNALNEYISTLNTNSLLFLTDDDIRFGKMILMDFANAAQEIVNGVVFGGALKVQSDIQPKPELASFYPSSVVGFPKPGQTISKNPIFLGANWAAFSEDIMRLGGFDPRFGPGSPLGATGQESQMMRKMKAAGFDFRFLPEAVVWHQVSPRQHSNPFLVNRWYRSGVESGIRDRFLKKDESSSFLRAYAKIAYYAARASLGTILIPLVTLIRSKTDATKFRCKIASYRGFLKGWISRSHSPQTPESADEL